MIIVLADHKEALISECQRLNVQAETFVGDPLDFDVDGIVSPANTKGEMSVGYDLVIRNRLGIICERNVQESVRENPIAVGEARAVPSGNSKVPVIIVAPTMTAAGGKISDPEIIFQATRAAVLPGHEARAQRLGMAGMGAGYGGLDIYAAGPASRHRAGAARGRRLPRTPITGEPGNARVRRSLLVLRRLFRAD